MICFGQPEGWQGFEFQCLNLEPLQPACREIQFTLEFRDPLQRALEGSPLRIVNEDGSLLAEFLTVGKPVVERMPDGSFEVSYPITYATPDVPHVVQPKE